ncbi:MAG TPA: FG-GAP-like repeat-containing protein [Gammaproteobacteria bacterium]|nr:FG-GAP-like repeat-containing protein [Gammaproteobacteria bacterium]
MASPYYDGATGQVNIDESHAGILAVETMIMAENIVALAYDAPALPAGEQTINQTNPGPDGGKVILSGEVKADGAGWITADYQNYKSSDNGTSFTYDGTIQISYGASSAQGQPIMFDLPGLTISTAAGSQTFTGNITKTKSAGLTAGTAKTNYVTDFAVFDHTLNASLKADYNIEADGPPISVTISGKLFDSRIGYVTVTTPEPMPFNTFDGTQTPSGGGSIALAGSGSDTAILAALNHYFGAVGLDTDGDGLADESTRVDWQAFDLDTTPTPSGAPAANAVSHMVAELGKTVKLDGRYSYTPNGNLVHFNWQLISAPAGSTAMLSNRNEAVATFVPDVAGDYLFRLEVSGSAGSSNDALVVQASPTDVSDTSEDTVPEAGPDTIATTGAKVALDGRASIGTNMGLDWSWDLYTPPGSQAALDNVNSAQPGFTPDVPGYYSAALSVTGCCSLDRSHVIINAGGPVHFDPAVDISPNLDTDAAAVGDLNNDGLPDIAMGGSNGLVIIYGRGNGHLSAPVVMPATSTADQVAIKDINGDGLADLVTAPYAGIDYRLQQPDGTLAPDVHIDDPDGCSGHMVIARLFGATRNSLVRENCSRYIQIFPPVTGGTLGAPVTVDSGALSYSGLAVGDVTGDGIADLVVTASATSYELLVSAGQAGGTFAPAVSYPTSQTAKRIMIADLNGDGRNDVVLFNGYSIDIVLQQSGGTMTDEKTLATTGSVGVPVIADVNGDGRADLIVGEQYSDPVNGTSRDETGLFIQGADGSLSREYLYPDFISGEENKIIVDLNGDGRADILTYGRVAALNVMYGDPPGSEQVQTLQTQALEHSPTKSSALRAAGVLRLPPLQLQLQLKASGLP